MTAGLRVLVRDAWQLLAFRLDREQLAVLGRSHFYVGFGGTWLAGIGRYWDSPKAEVAQKLGLGSLGYIFVLAALLWVVLRPVVGREASYWNLVTFVALTAFPAWLYAIPVERLVATEQAITLNVWLLGAVAMWRLALLFHFLRVRYAMKWNRVIVCCLLPMTAIIFLLAALNLEHAVFEIMGGLQQEQTPADGAYAVVIGLSFFSIWLFPFLVLTWGWFVYARGRRSRSEAR